MKSNSNVENLIRTVKTAKITSFQNPSFLYKLFLAIRNELIYLEIENGQIHEKSRLSMDNEIACIDCSPLQDNEVAPFCAVGLWNDISVSLLSLPDLKTLDKSQVCAFSVQNSYKRYIPIL